MLVLLHLKRGADMTREAFNHNVCVPVIVQVGQDEVNSFVIAKIRVRPQIEAEVPVRDVHGAIMTDRYWAATAPSRKGDG